LRFLLSERVSKRVSKEDVDAWQGASALFGQCASCMQQ